MAHLKREGLARDRYRFLSTAVVEGARWRPQSSSLLQQGNI